MVNIIFFVIVVLVFIWVVIDRLKEDKEWVSIMVVTENSSYKLNERYAYLKANDIRCRVNSISQRGIDQSRGKGVFNGRDMQTVSLDVYYKDMEKVNQLLKR